MMYIIFVFVVGVVLMVGVYHCVLMVGAGMYSCYGVYYTRVCCWCSVGVVV